MVKSSKPKKQRGAFHRMPLHKRQKSIASTLSKPLRKSTNKRGISLRKGDKVKVMRGTNKGKEGKVIEINYYKRQVFIEKIVRKKSDGTEKAVPIEASNLMITDLDKSDSRRMNKGKKTKESQKEKKKKPTLEKTKKAKVKEDGK